ncbi:class I SAM-dependent methyltransferase [Streptomyces sp. HUAS MG47]|uniref:class I SAM-dependent methyltransferase n=1 Tax=Streptomyces solicamelliae TaxID=3231716 RepID=UPI003877E567
MYSEDGPSFRELTVQALSSVEHGYDLLAPKFDATPFRTSDRLLQATTDALKELGPFATGLDVCCGTGAGLSVLESVCTDRVTGVDFSTGMLEKAKQARPNATLIRADALSLPFRDSFDLAISLGAFGHFLPRDRPRVFTEIHASLRPGALLAFPQPAPPRVGSREYWTLWAFDAVMRVRNAIWSPPFVMYYRTWPLTDVLHDLQNAGFEVDLYPMEALGRRDDGSPACRLVAARKV